jgi:hypothetical protein
MNLNECVSFVLNECFICESVGRLPVGVTGVQRPVHSRIDFFLIIISIKKPKGSTIYKDLKNVSQDHLYTQFGRIKQMTSDEV